VELAATTVAFAALGDTKKAPREAAFLKHLIVFIVLLFERAKT
jgi:hypothetical protein